VIVAPKRCYEPQALLEGKKLWGACVQLYTLRSDSNWGIGDFGDLKKMLATWASAAARLSASTRSTRSIRRTRRAPARTARRPPLAERDLYRR
jgi:hypothetical protein